MPAKIAHRRKFSLYGNLLFMTIGNLCSTFTTFTCSPYQSKRDSILCHIADQIQSLQSVERFSQNDVLKSDLEYDSEIDCKRFKFENKTKGIQKNLPGPFLESKLLLLLAICFPSNHLLSLFVLFGFTRAHIATNSPIKKPIRKEKFAINSICCATTSLEKFMSNLLFSPTVMVFMSRTV